MTARLGAPLVLASASPRRREILATLRVPFRVVTSDVDESRLADEEALAWVSRAARLKAEDVADKLAEEAPAPFVLGADTVVVLEGDAMGKPAGDDEARAMLRRLSGRWHEVVTALALARAGSGVAWAQAVVTRVCFRALSAEEIDGYVASGEGRDKAGAYAVQGLGSGLVIEVAGSYHNVVGLPPVETLQLLGRAGVLEAWP